jgi:uncharacterized membrane protein
MKTGLKRKKATKLYLVLFLFFIILLLSSSYSYAWSNGGFSSNPNNPKYGTHDWIAQHALDWLPPNEKQFILQNLALYLYGTELPDNNKAPDGIGDTSNHHVYFSSKGILVDDSSARRAEGTYQSALTFLLSNDFSEAAKVAGAMTHYISDVAVFGHVMGKETDWGAETHHNDYESYVDSKTSSYDSDFNVYLHFDGKLDIISAYNATVKLAYDTTFDSSGKGRTCVWMDKNYDWSNQAFKDRAGESLNLAVNYVTDVLHTLYVEYTTRRAEIEEHKGANFSLSVYPSCITVEQDGSANVTLTITPFKPLNTYVDIYASEEKDLTVVAPSLLWIANKSVVCTLEIITYSFTKVGVYNITINAKSTYPEEVESTYIIVNVTQAPLDFDFSVSIEPTFAVAKPGDNLSVKLTVAQVLSSQYICSKDLFIDYKSSNLLDIKIDDYYSSYILNWSGTTHTITMTIKVPKYISVGTYNITIEVEVRLLKEKNNYLSSSRLEKVVNFTLRVENFNFSIIATSTNATVQQGSNTTTTIRILPLSNLTQQVYLSASEVPSGITVVFNPPSGKPPFMSNVTIIVSKTVPVGMYSITIKGTGDSLTKSIVYSLNVAQSNQSQNDTFMSLLVFVALIAIIYLLYSRKKR